MQTVTDASNNSVANTYLANSPLVGQIDFAQSGNVRMTTTRQYDYLNRLTSISSSPSNSFAYQYNTANQRTSATEADGSYWIYTYDSLGQATGGRKFWPDGAVVAGQQFGYSFDDIGNRTWTTNNSRPAHYLANSLNQYTSRDVPPFLNGLGSANSNATVTLWADNGLYAPTSRKGDYFRGELPLNNSTGALWLTITNLAVLNNGTSADIVSSAVGNAFLATTPEVFGYDADGNLTNDGRWLFTWDGENRLVALTPSAAVAPQQSLNFEYDWKGRRVHKRVWANMGWSGTPTNDVELVYDGWNLLAELNATSHAVIRSYLWGNDLSGTIQGAGGVGGLLAVQGAETDFVAYDGNGNVSALVSSADGTISGQYEYGPFGEVIRATGPMAKVNPFRFSTKYQDDETDLLYYGYRYYNASTGRWLSRDPIAEKGGANLYAFARNDAQDRVDVLGQDVNLPPGGNPLNPWPYSPLPPYQDGLEDPSGMLLYGLFGHPFSQPTLSDAFVMQAKNAAQPFEQDMMADLRLKAKCGKAGVASAGPKRFDYGIGSPNTGKWQLDLTANCVWSCENASPSDCCCKCNIACRFTAHFGKTWTFGPGYNPNNDYWFFRLLWLSTLYNQQSLYGQGGGMYFMSGDFTDSGSLEWKRCEKASR